jgi:hypothetical protein
VRLHRAGGCVACFQFGQETRVETEQAIRQLSTGNDPLTKRQWIVICGWLSSDFPIG